MSTRLLIYAAVVCSLPLFVALKCDKEGNPVLTHAFSANVVMQNLNPDSVHILAPGESFGPGNKLAPQASRSLTMILEPEDSYQFRVGSGGVVITQVSCSVRALGKASDTFTIQAHSTTALACGGSGWSRLGGI